MIKYSTCTIGDVLVKVYGAKMLQDGMMPSTTLLAVFLKLLSAKILLQLPHNSF